MFGFLKSPATKKSTKASGTTQLKCTLTGMHCSSCAMNIDGALEDTPGVVSATTSYAKALVAIEYDPAQVQPAELVKIIENEGYRAVPI